MNTVADIFAFWPSDADLGRDIGVPYPTDILLSAHTPARDEKLPGFREEEKNTFIPGEDTSVGVNETARRRDGHFSRHKHIRRNRFKSAEEIEDHIRALRDEWSHR
jgi:hypothetical protein